MKKILCLVTCSVLMLMHFYVAQADQVKFPVDWAKQIDGTYRGHLLSSGQKSEVSTTFKHTYGGGITGLYEFNDNGHKEEGTFTDCKPGEAGELFCDWKDKYGVGVLEVNFALSLDEFNGAWGEKKVDPEAYWNGKKQ
ncbi:hypothetical protein O4H49_10545 [Kiloniella laminariae]|uniref:Uncharacterized protein n=1 Tax=Kiloniella laminariae TaxID=454162 RepID=A0ABT4LMM4_9PROT|nr:hypothetical protein [Kiloniella laminariae]MCZ4281217.1 hypothetical protein [Kiloniella laminariae]